MSFLRQIEHAMKHVPRRTGAVVLLVCAGVALPVAPASAGWQQAERDAVEVQRVCRDGVQLQVARIDFGGDEQPPDEVTAHLVVADPPPTEPAPPADPDDPPTRYDVDPEDVVVDRPLVLDELHPARTIVTDDQQEFRLSHLKKAKYRFSRRLAVGTTVGISSADFALSAAVLQHPVKRCRLFR